MNSHGKNSEPSTILHLHKFSPKADASTPEPETGLTAVVKVAADELVKKSGPPVIPREGGELPPKEMLGAVSYCYAKGVYTSEEIERKMLRDPQLRESVHGNVPSANAIRRFRALNRRAIQQTLEKVFRALWKKQKPAAEAKPAGPTPRSDENTVAFGRREAADRLEQAAFVDNMSKE